jgi:hypothetical protein
MGGFAHKVHSAAVSELQACSESLLSLKHLASKLSDVGLRIYGIYMNDV